MDSSDVGRGTTTITALQSSREGVDFGYDSQSSGMLEDGFHECSTQSPTPPTKRLCQRKIQLRRINVQVADEVQIRFRDLKTLFETLLHDHLGNDGQRLAPIAITLQYHGETEADAKPCVVVLCEKAVSKQVKQWFETGPAKSLCQSPNTAADANNKCPGLEVLVHERPPRLLSEDVYSIGVLGPDANHFTMCGRLLRTHDPIHGRLATFGGLVKLTWETRFAIYGITVQHVFQHSLSKSFETGVPRQSVSAKSNFTNILSRSEMMSGKTNGSHDERHDILELDLSAKNNAMERQNNTLHTTRDLFNSSLVTRVGMQCPDSVVISNDNSTTGVITSECVDLRSTRLLDWALFNVEDSSKLWPNLLCDSTGPHDLEMQQSMNFEEGLEKNVHVISGMSGLLCGRILKVPLFITLLNPHRLIETYCLSLDDGFELQSGDSGSWVVDVDTHNVYGQVVASDVFEIVYVVPFGNIVQEIKDTYGAKSVTFPTYDELDFCAFSRPHNVQKGQHQQYDNIEDACGEFDLAGLDSYLSGNTEIPGVIQDTSLGSFTPVTDAREATKLQMVDSRIIDRVQDASESDLKLIVYSQPHNRPVAPTNHFERDMLL